MLVKLLMTTVGDKDAAEKLAQVLLDSNSCACVSCVPGAQSHYRWKGEVCCEEEVQIFVKTSIEKLPALQELLLKVHPYDCPEVLVWDAESANPEYSRWLIDSMK